MDQDRLEKIEEQQPSSNTPDQENDPLLKLAELIRADSVQGKLTPLEYLETLESPEEETVVEQINLLLTDEAYSDIIKLEGQKDKYFYSSRHMADNYAIILIKIADGNLFELIASTVRHESKLYPRPTDGKLFLKAPFNFQKENLEKVLSQIKNHEAYQDINEVYASNGALYLYSNQYLSQTYAKSLAQWIEIEQFETP